MLEPYFQYIHHLAIGDWMRDAIWRIPAVEFVHLVGIVLLFGSLLIVNLRLFGIVLRTQPIAQVSGDVAGFRRVGLILMLLSGPVLFITSAVKFYMTPPFWWKMGFLVLALLFQFTVHARLTRRQDSQISISQAYSAAIVSLGLWCSVLFNGMWTLLS